MKILYPFHVTGFESLLDEDNNEAKTAREEMLCAIFYLEHSEDQILLPK